MAIKGRTRFKAPIDEETFLDNLSIKLKGKPVEIDFESIIISMLGNIHCFKQQWFQFKE